MSGSRLADVGRDGLGVVFVNKPFDVGKFVVKILKLSSRSDVVDVLLIRVVLIPDFVL